MNTSTLIPERARIQQGMLKKPDNTREYLQTASDHIIEEWNIYLDTTLVNDKIVIIASSTARIVISIFFSNHFINAIFFPFQEFL